METNIDNVIPVESQWQLWYLTCCHLNQVIVREHASGFGPTEKVCFLSVHRVLPACNGAPFKCSFPMLWKINCTQRFSLCFLFVIIIIFSATVFTTTIQFDYNTIAGRIRELAFLNPEVNWLRSVNASSVVLAVLYYSSLAISHLWYAVIASWSHICSPICVW